MEEQPKKQALKTYKGSISIVTGAASGIGRALAVELAAQGALAVVLVDRQAELLEEVAALIKENTASMIETKTYEVDVRDFEDVQRVVTETVDTFGRLDYCFNNAGTLVGGSLEQIGIEDFNYVLDVNVRGASNGCLAAYPVFKVQGFGHLVNTASMAGLLPVGEGFVAYSTSKYAVVGLSLNLRIEGACHGVKVSVICPGAIDTPLLTEGGKYGKIKSGASKEDLEKIWKKYHPMEPGKFAANTLKLVAKNKPIIIVPSSPFKFMWFVNRMFPSLGLCMARKQNDKIMTPLKEKLSEKNNE